MKRRRQKGQAAIEAAFMVFALMMIFISVYYTTLRALWKIRSLDLTFATERALDVTGQALSATQKLILAGSTFDHPALIQEKKGRVFSVGFLSPSPGSFHWVTTQSIYLPPQLAFLQRSWPKAPVDPGASTADLAKDTIGLETVLHAPLADSVIDAGEETQADGAVAAL